MNSIINQLEAEITASKRSSKPINLYFTKVREGLYRAVAPFKIEGEYILNAKGITDKAVFLEYKDNKTIEMEIDSDEDKITAFLTKDESSILKAIKNNIRMDQLSDDPSFIVGPPGTGKTKVITKIIEEAIKNGKRVLVTSPTNLAVENVFERFNLKLVKEDELVITIKTDVEYLKKYSPKAIKNAKLQPINDEIEILLKAKEDILKLKRDIQPLLNNAKTNRENYRTILSNLKKDLGVENDRKKACEAKIKEIEERVELLNKNSLLKNIANFFMKEKMEKMLKEKEDEFNNLCSLNKKIDSLKEKIKEVESKDKSVEKDLSEEMKKVDETNKTLSQIEKRVAELKKEKQNIQYNDIYSTAKVVGATLTNAALNQKIQAGEFDMIIVDEASMALFPLVLVASQSLKSKKLSKVKYKADDALYEAQNRAVKMALNKKIVIVGDPMQLQPIAKTYDLKQSIFDVYGVNNIFDGQTVENTVFLDINFRNHPEITNLSSQMFYGGMLKSGKEDDERSSLYIKRSTSKMVPSKNSYINYGNMKIVVNQVAKAVERGRRDIGIITPYREQALLIEQNLSALKNEYPDADIQVGTVHTFQGKEKEIVIFDVTFSPSDNGAVPATYNGDIKSNTANLLNVATTRAKDFFIIVGDADGILNYTDKSLALYQWIDNITSLREGE